MVTKVYLYVLVFNKQTLKHDILSLDKDLIKIPFSNIDENSNIEQVMQNLFESCVDLSSKYMSYKLQDVSIENKELHISYFTILPFGIKTKHSFLLPTQDNEKYSENIKRIIRLL